MLSEICAEIKNYFCSDIDKHFGHFAISGGTMPMDFLLPGQYFRVVGSIFNDGVWQYPASNMIDEEFDGAVWALAIPKAVISIADEIAEYERKSGGITPFISESFGGYSYTKATGASGTGVTWKEAFRSRLNCWRKI